MTQKTSLPSFFSHTTQTAGLSLLIKASTLLKSSFIIGSLKLFFSASSITMPLTGAFTNPMTCFLVFIIRGLLLKSWTLASLALVVPGFCAALYWNMDHWSVRFLIPLNCFVLFVCHPVGNQASLYALYWLIPMALYFVPNKGIFLTALASTLTAHAVGSVIWLYTVPMTVDMWLGLIPLVAIERLCNAIGMVVLYQAVHMLARSTTILYQKYVSITAPAIINAQS